MYCDHRDLHVLTHSFPTRRSSDLTGTLPIGDRVIDIRTMGHRDHSWGTRDWGALHFYRWLQSQAGEDMSVHFWEFYALGERQLRGYVCKDGLMAEITTLDLRWQRSEEHTSELQSLMRNSYAVFCLKHKR